MSDGSFRDFVLEQLADMRELRCKAMFGGHGPYQGDVFFGIIHGGSLYFRTDPASRSGYVSRGMRPFMPRPERRLKAYFEVPSEVLEDPEELVTWANRAIRAR